MFKWILEFILIDSHPIGGILKNFGLTASFCRMINFICLCVFHIFAKFSQNFRIHGLWSQRDNSSLFLLQCSVCFAADGRKTPNTYHVLLSYIVSNLKLILHKFIKFRFNGALLTVYLYMLESQIRLGRGSSHVLVRI